VAAGSLAERHAALQAAKTASVLESHDGVNGGLDASGRHKRRNSDEVTTTEQPPDDYLVYIHHVQPNDTYAGIILRYRCREDVFRKANGLWSRDSVQTRKWLTLPVEACEIRGRPCGPPTSTAMQQTDLLAPSPAPSNRPQPEHDEYFNSLSEIGESDARQMEQDNKPWSHVRWVQIESFQTPVEIGRVSRQSMGYFPPRRKKSILSALSTPRQSLDFSTSMPGPSENHPTRRQSSLGSQPQLSLTPISSRSRGGSEAAENRPTWMRRPGGVGTMGRSIRAPGPDKDALNAWANKHFPGLNIDRLPSMSIMDSEVAHFGFNVGSSSIAGSSFAEGRQDAAALNKQGTGLDRAAAAVETWLRGALAKRPTTPLMRPRSKGATTMDSDLIELTDTGSDDGKFHHEPIGSLIEPLTISGTSSHNPGIGSATMRNSAGPCCASQHRQSATKKVGTGQGNTCSIQATRPAMPICIECRHPVKTLWTQYSGAGDKASGHNIRLTVCRKCGRFCDKYVEHDFVVIFIDLVLIKPQPSIVRLGTLLLLFDVYLTWARIENQGLPGGGPGESNLGKLAQQPIVIQYFFFLMLCTLSTIAFHIVIRFLVASSLSPLVALGILPRYRRPNSVSTALLVSSSTKLFPILLVIWDYDVPAAARSLGWAVVANNVEALRILIDCRYYVACLLALIGAAARWSVAHLVLIAVGLNDVDSISVDASMAADTKALWTMVTYVTDWAGRLAAMCKNIVEKGNLDSPLLIYNRSKQRAIDLSQKLPAGKTEVVESLVDAAGKADIIFTCISNDEAVAE
ncbi:hypothetical protein LLEC1_07842, partial [Akanthomyces lecanii]